MEDQDFYKSNEDCKFCLKNFPCRSILRHIAHSKKCKPSYTEDELNAMKARAIRANNAAKNLKRKRVSNSDEDECSKKKSKVDPSTKKAERNMQKSQWYQKNKARLKEQRAAYYQRNKAKIAQQYRDRVAAQKELYKELSSQIRRFRNDCMYGPIFPCASCHRTLFRRGVTELTSEMIALFKKNDVIKYIEKKGLKIQGKYFLCHNCTRHLSNKKMPPINVNNGLSVPEIPDCLKLTPFETQLIAKNLIFIKISHRPKTRMAAMNDRVVNIPIEDNDIIKTVSSLPRNTENDGLVTVKLKRRLKYKTYYKQELIRPDKVYCALEYLVKNHPEYQSIDLVPFEEWVKDCQNEDIGETDTDGELKDQESSDEETEKDVEEASDNIFNEVTCLIPEDPQSSVLVNNSSSAITKKMTRNSTEAHVIAPGEGKIPSNWLNDEKFDICGFPQLFPNGKFGLNHPRDKKISPAQFFSSKILNHNKMFSENPDFVFVAQQYLERYMLEKQIDISIQRGKVIHDGSQKKIARTSDAFDVFKKIVGSPAYFKSFRNDFFARLEQLGSFHFFFTLSSAEMRWTEVITSILESTGHSVVYETDWEEDETKILIDGYPLPTYKEKYIKNMSEFLRPHTLMITRIFDNRIKSFIKTILLAEDVENYTYRIEFQARGMPHLHGVFWLTHEAVSKYYEPNSTTFSNEKVSELIDQWISCSLTSGCEKLDKIVREVNVHRHTKSCMKRGKKCRFNFPRLPSNYTLVASPKNDDSEDEEVKLWVEKAKVILNTVKTALEELTDEDIEELDDNLEEFLKQLNVDCSEYHEALKISEMGKVVILKRKLSERFVNNYNPRFLLAWNGNSDIQLCLDSYAIVSYITDYLSKDDSGLTTLLRNALKETRDCDDFDRLNHLKKVYFMNKQVCLCEAAYRLIPGMNLKGSNVKSIFVSTGFPENRSCFFKKLSSELSDDGDINDEDELSPELDDTVVKIEGRKGRFKRVETIHEKYEKRPKAIDRICLAQFATSYESCQKPKHVVFKNCVSEETGTMTLFEAEIRLPRHIQLSNDSFMRLRNSPMILRIHNSMKKKGFEDIYSELLLFFPWRDEAQLFANSASKCSELYSSVKEIVFANRKSIFPHSSTIDEMRAFLDSVENHRSAHLSDMIDPIGQQEDMDDKDELEPLDLNELPDEELGSRKMTTDGSRFKPIVVDEHETMLQLARSLSFEQRIVFDKIIKYCKTLIMHSKGANIMLQPPRLIVTGGGGCGKSHLIKVVSKWTEKLLRRPGDNYEKLKHLLLGFTGMAASLIGGTTLHSGLGFKFGVDSPPLSEEKLVALRKELEDLEFVTIDEISMVSSDMLYDVHKRLQQILISRDLFGGRAVLLVGDLLQLPPVKGFPIYTEPSNFKSKTLWKSSDSLWANFEVVVLETNFRQGDGNPWTECLNRYRIGKPTKDDIKLLEKRKTDTSALTNATHIYFTNEEVNFYNTSKLNLLTTPLVEIKATYNAPPGYTPKVKNGVIDRTQFRMDLQLKIGARVMVIFNIRIPDSLVNGSLGTVVDFIRHGQDGDIKAVVVRFDDPEAGREHMKDNVQDSAPYQSQRGCPIYRSTLDYPIPYSSSASSKSHFAKVSLCQFPLKLAWASTAHKVQGLSIKQGSDVALHGHPYMPPGMGYVMLSRSEDINNVHLDNNFQLMQVRPNKRAFKENTRLTDVSIVPAINEKYFDIYLVNIRSLSRHFPDLKQDIFAQRSSQICLVETWIEPNDTELPKWDEKESCGASVGKGKGCVVYSDIGTANSTVKIANPQFQCIFQNVYKGYQLVTCYLSSDCPLNDVIEVFKVHLSTTMPKIIVGDFNFQWNKRNKLTKYLEDEGFKQLIQEPTHECGNTLDHCYVSEDLADFVGYELHYPYFSDHCALCISVL